MYIKSNNRISRDYLKYSNPLYFVLVFKIIGFSRSIHHLVKFNNKKIT